MPQSHKPEGGIHGNTGKWEPPKRASTYWHCHTERIQWKNLSEKTLTPVFSLGFWEGRGILTWIFSSVCTRPAEARKLFL